MKKIICCFVIALNVLIAQRSYLNELYQKIRPSIVAVDVDVPEEIRKEGILKRGIYYGTGFVIGKNLVLTTRKVMQDKLSARCICYDNRIIKAQVVAYDEHSPLTLLKINYPQLPALELSEEYAVGDLVVSVGNTYGSIAKVSEFSVSYGMVSGIYDFERWGIVLRDIMETDCAINPGIYGGPIINMHGKIVATCFSGYAQDRHKGLGIPSPTINNFLQRYYANKIALPDEFFFLQTFPVYLGVELALENRRPKIVAIEPESPAEEGLLVGDKILQINDFEITSIEKFRKIIQTYFPGQKVSLTIRRKKMIIVVPVALTARFMR
ncbi:S1C family serine protease [Candidatus Uabimicrobium amorphum]|uniref:Serine protease n=1 Tax=Uabimicrobium amorphum TaxID=2596890 RepID=A0A5S9IKQ3_UABAM|nr:trypsin-like peptidase domain-containing protein [Candidatus Uabimicrobium amorphum]BBM83659.1 serine protease [Candidatus Uabimicrobium amorphum]